MAKILSTLRGSSKISDAYKKTLVYPCLRLSASLHSKGIVYLVWWRHRFAFDFWLWLKHRPSGRGRSWSDRGHASSAAPPTRGWRRLPPDVAAPRCDGLVDRHCPKRRCLNSCPHSGLSLCWTISSILQKLTKVFYEVL